ncbi:hypothetical protein HHL22_02480 [Hymenobacter sp. RP-2-7]|uniref:DUF7878 domain-containing protein n=1 Tax=Hymenobacter polaris TaxID=2682546 RepID=A0A7Y0AB07_9BACT|nr:hypothetical protein [Hymenobacter polaris]NML64061.1 hypothetical protein [Hymenobacter polaris]
MTLVFTITEVNRGLLLKYPYAALDGDLTITANDTTFFLESVALLDFALAVQHWLHSAAKTSVLLHFDYSPEDSTDNPVLYLTPLAIAHFAVHSAWVESPIAPVVSLPDVTAGFENFLLALNEYMQREYNVAFADIPLFKQP